MDFD